MLDRARAGVEALAERTAELEAALPARVSSALRSAAGGGAAGRAQPVAEVRGLSAQTIRRLERLETILEAERRARVEDLALLVDLVASGWRSAERRLDRLERTLERVERELEQRARPRPRSDRCKTRPRARRLAALGEHEREARSAPGLGFELDTAAERVGELAGDREAEPGALAVARPERPEDAAPAPRAGSPGPLSLTLRARRPFWASRASEISPPSGVHSNALMSRLETIWSTRSPSVVIIGASPTWRP